MKVYLETYGCTLNQADSDIMEGVLREGGHSISSFEDADVVVLNTCTVKGRTENKIVSRIEALAAVGKPLVVAGCLGINEKRVRTAAPTAVIVHPGAVARICEAVEHALQGKASVFAELEKKEGLARAYTAPILRIPVQEGCVGNCSFCQTKLARPELLSYSIPWIKSWVEEGLRRGAKEVQLTGMDAGAYGLDIGTDLLSLLREVGSIEGDFRVRMGMINPGHAKRMLPGLLEVFGNEKFYKFFHLPVQTGSEKVRGEMNRAHTVADFRAVVGGLRGAFPEAVISTDIIVGYPTETEEDFAETRKLIEEVRPDIVNISKFASRRGTPAAELPEIHTAEVKRRSTELTSLVQRIGGEKNKEYVGRELDVLVTELQKTPTGRAFNYKQVCVQGDAELGSWVKVKIESATHGSLMGKLI